MRLDGFAIARYPVTVAEYRHFVEDEGYRRPEWWSGGGHAESDAPAEWDTQFATPNRPVVGVSWPEACAYCAWLTVRAGARGLAWPGPGRVVRLPAEAGWMRAARGAAGRRFPWGNADATPERLNFSSNIGRPTPVGVYPSGATPDGIVDLAGNVWEWCHDRYGEHYYRQCAASAPAGNPLGPGEGEDRVLRGGSWRYDARHARAAYRNNDHPDNRNDNVGFRVVCPSHIEDWFPGWPGIDCPARRLAQRSSSRLPGSLVDHGWWVEGRAYLMARASAGRTGRRCARRIGVGHAYLGAGLLKDFVSQHRGRTAAQRLTSSRIAEDSLRSGRVSGWSPVRSAIHP